MCPICEQKLLDFHRFDNGQVFCPICLSLARHRLLWLYIKDKLKDVILHVAPERFLQEKIRGLGYEYMSIDLEMPHALEKMDLTSLDFVDESFNTVICYHVLEHVDNDRKALKELYRVLKPDGTAYIQVPIGRKKTTTRKYYSEYDRQKYFGQADHVRAYGEDFYTRLEKVGFKVQLIKNTYNSDLYGLNEGEYIVCCFK